MFSKIDCQGLVSSRIRHIKTDQNTVLKGVISRVFSCKNTG